MQVASAADSLRMQAGRSAPLLAGCWLLRLSFANALSKCCCLPLLLLLQAVAVGSAVLGWKAEARGPVRGCQCAAYALSVRRAR